MKTRFVKTTFATAVALLMWSAATAQPRFVVRPEVRDTTVCGVTLQNAAMKRTDNGMNVDMDFALSEYKVKSNVVTVLTPLISNGRDSVELTPVGIYGRIRWYQYLRSGDKPLGGDNEQTIRWSECPETLAYNQTVPYEEWMNGAQLVLRRCDYSCCREMIAQQHAPLGSTYNEVMFTPKPLYQRPAADALKLRELSGRAYIDFPVNRTELYPDYRKNPTELAKIIATIDSIRNDSDITVREITIKGYASPEGTYENNTRLAQGRTQTLKDYVQSLYHFPAGFIHTDYEPEDWEGLRNYVVTSSLPHRDEIMAIIDDPTLEPDTKDWRMKLRYPEDYKVLLETVYPGLRHSDYTIEYTIRQFSDIRDIERMLHTQPQKLSLEEMFLLAQSYEEGSDEYNEVFETAVRMYPNDETANLNAAYSAMSRNDLAAAEKYLAKAGDTPEAVYARGKLAAMQGDFDAARQHFGEAARTMPEAREVLGQLDRYETFK